MAKKLFRFTEHDLHEIVSTSIKKILKEYDVGSFSFDHKPNFELKFVGKNEILPIADQIWDMLIRSYANIGGLKTYEDKEQFLGMVKYAKLVYDSGTLVACATYRKVGASFKMVAIGCNQRVNGKLGIQEIIKDDILKLDDHFWAEVSGAIEYYFKKYNGYPMPNTIVPNILKKDVGLFRFSNEDKVHYEREIGGRWHEKMIFGIKDEETYKAALGAVDDYSKFMKEVNTLQESNNHLRYSLTQAEYIVDNIYDAHTEQGFNEMIPSWYQALTDALETFKWSKANGEAEEYADDYIESCEFLFNDMPLLELHELKL